MIKYNYIDVPTYENGEWTITSFETRKDFSDFVLSVFKEPGKYEFDETSLKFNENAITFRKNKFFNSAPAGTKDFVTYWNFEKEKCRRGAIFKNGKNVWYLTRDYYMWVNFLPINNKETRKFDFPDIRDAQYHMALYELLAELNYLHCAILKKRQIASSYFHCAKLINQIWFEETPILKIGASLKDYINNKGSWKFLEEYRSFLNEHTAWYRPMNPGGMFMWQQQIETTIQASNRKIMKGLKGTLQGVTFEKDATSGVGGPCTYFFHEEAGIAPKMDETVEYLYPALQSGDITTGMFIAAGSVGDLNQCEPLRKMIEKPEVNSIYPVYTNLLDEKGTWGTSGLFIPEQWSMPPYIDEFGNSLVEKALAALDEKFEKWKKELSPEKYQLRISQHPRNIAEAFAAREVSRFPMHLVKSQKKRIEDKEYSYEFVDLGLGADGKIIATPTKKLPIMDFPVNPNLEDKSGSIVVWERPSDNPGFGAYYASVDPVGEGKAEHVDNMLYTPTGRKRIGDIKVGDKVIGSNGQSINVVGVYPQGIKKLYKITFSDGHSIKVCEDHLWNVKLNGGTKGYITLSVKDLLDTKKTITYKGTGRNIKKEYTISTYYKDKQNRNKWSIPIVKPIEFVISQDTPINPYLLGLLLGDGGLSQRSIRFSTVDEELVTSIQFLLTDDLMIKKVKNSNCDYSITTKAGSRNSLSQKLKHLGLKGKTSKDKFIPVKYMYSSGSNRLSLLQGLMDTDGSYTNHGAEFYSSSKTLAYQVVELVQSLGGIAKIRCKKTTHLDSYIVRVSLPIYLNPFILKRKREIYKPSKVFSRYITDIQYVEDAEAVCISVDSPDNLYVTEHAIVTHNTTTSESLCAIFIYKNPVEVTKVNGTETETFIEREGIVASWCGRFDDINKTHERLEMLIEWYNAWTIVENNIPQFVTHMIKRHKQRFLVPKSQMLFLKELNSNNQSYSEYGWRNTGTLFRGHLLSYAIEYLSEELDSEYKSDGSFLRKVYGIERIPDIMLLTEMERYQDDMNVDRLVAFSAMIAFVKIQQANRGYAKRTDVVDKKYLENSPNLYKLNNNPFRHIGKRSSNMTYIYKKPFKNIK